MITDELGELGWSEWCRWVSLWCRLSTQSYETDEHIQRLRNRLEQQERDRLEQQERARVRPPAAPPTPRERPLLPGMIKLIVVGERLGWMNRHLPRSYAGCRYSFYCPRSPLFWR